MNSDWKNIAEGTSKDTELHKAKLHASFAHRSQKYGTNPYMYHLVGVVNNINKLFDLDEEQRRHCCVVGYLHDVLEDTDTSEEFLLENFGDRVLRDVRALTKPNGMFYPKYIKRLIEDGSLEALVVKLADLEFNMEQSETRMKSENRNFKHMFEKYGLAKMLIIGTISERNETRILRCL